MASASARALREATGRSASELAEAYLAATSHAYDGEATRAKRRGSFAPGHGRRGLRSCAGLARQDALDADAFAEHEGGFAAAAAEVGASPRSTISTHRARRAEVRTLRRRSRARSWTRRQSALARGQMRHGHRGAAEIAQSLDNLFCFAALTDAVESAQFDLMFDATLGDDAVRAFLVDANRRAACHMATYSSRP